LLIKTCANNKTSFNSFKLLIGLLLIANAVKATDVNCNFQGTPGNGYPCNPTSMDAITSQSQAINIIQNHVNGGSNALVDSLYIINPSIVNYVPTKIFDSLQNIKVFTLYQTELKALQTNSFVNCLNMESIGIYYNPLETIEASFAEGCTNLKYLSIYDGSQIKSINKDAFKGLSKVEYIHLGRNNITKLDPATFSHTKGLKDLSLTNNLITELDVNLFAGLINLTSIELNWNRIKVLPALDLANMPILQRINLRANLIEAVTPNFFTDSFPGSTTRANWYLSLEQNVCVNKLFTQNQLPQPGDLDTCTANWNAITTTTTSTTASGNSLCPSHKDCRFFLDERRRYTCVLERVDLALASIGGVHDVGFSNSDVTRVYFLDSELANVPRAVFDSFANVEFLSVAETHLSVISDDTFKVCGTKLKKLDASRNQITRIYETSLQKCSALEWLDLTGNAVEDLDRNLFQFDPTLQHVIFNRRLPEL